jgi:hypothetical protein
VYIHVPGMISATGKMLPVNITMLVINWHCLQNPSGKTCKLHILCICCLTATTMIVRPHTAVLACFKD